MTSATKELNIYQRINAIRLEGSIYLQKGDAGHGTGVGYDDLISKLAPLLAKHGIMVLPQKLGDSKARQNAKGNYIYESDYEVHYINIDNPEDRFIHRVESHAQDNGDKATGKCLTYATKMSELKVFNIESGDNEESREETADNIYVSPQQAQQLYDILCLESGHYNEVGAKVATAFKIKKIQHIKASKFDLIMQSAQAAQKKLIEQPPMPINFDGSDIKNTPLLERKIELYKG